MSTVISDADSVQDFCWGLTFFGTGGGGRIEAGTEMLLPIVRRGELITLSNPDELPDDTLACWAVMVGGKEPETPPPLEELRSFGLEQERYPDVVSRLIASVRELESCTGRRVGALVSLELSSAATSAAIRTAHELGISILDSDCVGRAIPELPLTKLELLRHSPFPIVMIDRWGNSTTLNSGVSSAMADRIGRMMSRAAFGGGIATVGNLTRLNTIKPALVRGSLTKAIEVGAALRRAAGQEDSLERLLDVTGGKVLGSGKVMECKWRDTEPYTFRELTYRIEDLQSSAEMEIWIKNEHHIVRLDGDVIATSPDVIAVLELSSNRPLTSLGEVYPGMHVVVIGMSALDPIWHSPDGETLLGPRHFGFAFDPVRPSAA